MNHPVRRKDRQIPAEEARALFEKGEYLFMATADKDGQPYSVPISYALIGDVVYIHCATEGRKLKNLAQNPKVCLNVVGPTQPVYDGGFSTYYESAIIEGKARLVTGDEEKRRALTILAERYLPDHMDKAEANITGHWKNTLVYAVSIDNICGKAKRKKPATKGD